MKTNLESLYLYILAQLPIRQLGVFEEWRNKTGSFENVLKANLLELKSLGFNEKLITKLQSLKKELLVEGLVEKIKQSNVKVMSYLDPLYPKLLKEIYDAPPVLFYRGNFVSERESCVAIVGSRSMSSYSNMVMPRIAEPLINAGVTIVSGLALGVDSAAHKEAVLKNGRTIAVLGSGVDEESVYPRQHSRLADQILECGGLLISEHAPGTPALKHHFIARNRIIAGLSLGIVIVECKAKSGALITADYAADFNRSLFAVPGAIYSKLSVGPNSLIQNGASLITSGEDVLQELSISIPYELAQKPQVELSEVEERVLKCMRGSPVTVDAIMEHIQLPSHTLMQTLTLLELRGTIKNVGVEGFLKL